MRTKGLGSTSMKYAQRARGKSTSAIGEEIMGAILRALCERSARSTLPNIMDVFDLSDWAGGRRRLPLGV